MNKLPPLHFHIERLVDILDKGQNIEVVYEGRDYNGVRHILSYKLIRRHPSYRDVLAIFGAKSISKLTWEVAKKLEGQVVTYIMDKNGSIELSYTCAPIPIEMFNVDFASA